MPDTALINTIDTKLIKTHSRPQRGPGGRNKLAADEMRESRIG